MDMTIEQAPLVRGDCQWEGVVMIERPDISKMPYGSKPMCRVMSAKTVQLNGRRAICEVLPYELFAHIFTSEDGDHVFCEAGYKEGHLEVFGRARTNLKEWVLYSMTQEHLMGDKVNDTYQ